MNGENALSQNLLDFILGKQPIIPDELLQAHGPELRDAVVTLLVNILYHVNALPPDSNSLFGLCRNAEARLRTAEEQRRGGEDERIRPSEYVALIALNAASLERRLRPASSEAQRYAVSGGTDPDQLGAEVGHLVPRAARAILAIYDPSLVITPPGVPGLSQERKEATQYQRATRAWRELNPKTFKYWRMGTTSLIIGCSKFPSDAAAYPEPLILKCVVFPWNLIPAIADSTSNYADRYGALGSVVVRAEASSSRWVLMPFQDGDTLAERIKKQPPNDGTAFRQIAFAKDIALKLAAGLDALSGGSTLDEIKPDNQHLDLSPSNIILAPGATPEEDSTIRFIDLGQNFLYTRQIGIADHDDAVYVAPEVKNRGASGSSDIFSLAVIIIELLSGVKARDGRVPDSVYEISPLIGRLLDDMLDDDAAKRLLLVEHSGQMRFGDVSHNLKETFDLVKHEPVASDSASKRLWATWAPASHEVSSLLAKLWGLRKEDGRDQLRNHLGYLVFMSLIANAAWWYIFISCAFFSFDDLALGKIPSFPHGQLLYASAIGFAQGMTLSKYYQTIFARLTLQGVRYPLAKVTEISMRLLAVLALPTTIIAVSWRPSLWAWTSAVSAAMIAGTNLLTLRAAEALTRRGRDQFSTVPRAGRQIPGGFEQWWWTMLVYAFIVAVIAAGLQTGWMHDYQADVIGLLVINFAIHYASKCVTSGPAVRGGLARAFTTGERLSQLHSSVSRSGEPSAASPPKA